MKIRNLFIAIIILFFFSNSTLAQNTYVPDDNFEQALIDLGFDTGTLNDSVPTNSMNTITALDISGKNIVSLIGIEDFVALTELNFSNNQLSGVDLSSINNLSELICYNNQLTELDLNANIIIENINCANNNISELDLSSNTTLKYLNCNGNQLTTLNLKNGNNTLMTGDDYRITGIDTRNNSHLYCTQVDNAEASKTYTTWFKDTWTAYNEDCTTFQVKMAYVPDDNFEQALIDFGYDSGALNDSIPTTSIKNITVLNIQYKNIVNLTGIEEFKALEQLICYNNQITNIDLSFNANLTYLNCRNNQLTALELETNTLLTVLDCGYNEIIDLDLSSNTFLTNVYGYNNQLTSLNLRNGNNSNLRIDVRKNPNLFCIQVDDAVAAQGYSNWYKERWTGYSEDCSSYIMEMTYVPDDNFEQVLIDMGYDLGIINDSVPTVAIKSASSLYLNYKNISNLTGIEDFTNLTYLSCYSNQLTELNLESNILLEVLNCSNNNLIDLDLSSNSSLTNFTGSNNQLTGLNLKNGNNSNLRIDVRNNPNLLCIQVDDAETSYTYTNWYKNAYTGYSEDCSTYVMEMTYVPDDNFEQKIIDLKLDFEEGLNDSVPTISLGFLTSLNVNNSSINDLTGIEDCKKLEWLDCSYNNIRFLYFYDNTELTELNCHENELIELILTSNDKLRELKCGRNYLRHLDLSANHNLEYVSCFDNMLLTLNIQNGNNEILSILQANRNLDLCILVDNVSDAENKPWTIDDWAEFSEDCSNHQVEMVYLPDDNFEQELINLGYDEGYLNDSVCKSIINTITNLQIYNKGIRSLQGIEEFSLLENLNISGNEITELDLSSNTELSILGCKRNSLDSLDLTYNTKLLGLNCDENQISFLDLSSCTELQTLGCGKNNLKNLDLSNNTKLKNLLCVYNHLIELDLSSNLLLEDFRCDYNQLIHLDLGSNNKLTRVTCYSNNLSTLNLKNGNNHNFRYFMSRNNPNLTCIQVDDSIFSENDDNWYKDDWATYSENCGPLGPGVPIQEYNSLVDLYNSTIGEKWAINDNWLDTINSTVDDWYGVTIEDGHVIQILLSNNNLQNSAFENHVNLPKLRWLDLGENYLTGFNFSVIDSLHELDTFFLYQNHLIFEDLIPGFSTYIYPNYADLFAYFSQAKVDSSVYVEKSVNEQFAFSILEKFISTNDQFQWYKEGIKIDGETNLIINFSPVTKADSGSYYLEITNTGVPGLVLKSHYKYLDVTETSEAGVPISEYNALIDFYNNLNGNNWINNTNWLDTINHSVSDWAGIQVTEGHVRMLSLDSNNVAGILPNTLADLKYLELLSLFQNNITGNLPNNIGELSSLRSFSLGKNNLSGEIPASIIQMESLYYLGLSNNNMDGIIPTAIGNNANLEAIYFDNNNFHGTIPESIGNLSKLRHLRVNNNELSGTIPASIGNLNELRTLSLNNNQLIGPLPVELENLTKVYRLNIDNNLIGNIDSGEKSATLKSSTVENNRQIPDELDGLISMDTFRLGNNNLQFNDIEAIFSWNNFNDFKDFIYFPQGLIGVTKTVSANTEDTIFLSMDNYYPGNSDEYEWYKNWSLIPNAKSATLLLSGLKLSDAGEYHCKVTNPVVSELTLTSKLIMVEVIQVGIDDQNLSEFKVYPNPAQNQIFIDTKNETINLKVFNLTGNLVLEKNNIHSGWMDINQFTRGVYVFRAISSNSEIINRKVIFK